LLRVMPVRPHEKSTSGDERHLFQGIALLTGGRAGHSLRRLHLQAVAIRRSGESRASAFSLELQGDPGPLYAAMQLPRAPAGAVATGQCRSLLLDLERDLPHLAPAARARELPFARKCCRGLRQRGRRADRASQHGSQRPGKRGAPQDPRAGCSPWRRKGCDETLGKSHDGPHSCQDKRRLIGGAGCTDTRERAISPRTAGCKGGGQAAGRITPRKERPMIHLHHLVRGWLWPVIAGAIALEAGWYLLFRRQSYPWREMWASIGVYLLRFPAKLLRPLTVLPLALLVWSHRIATVPLDTVWGWAAAFVGVELAYYWMHRLSHEVRWLWASHIVHHTPEHIHLASAFRLGATELFSGNWLFYLPLYWLGLNPLAVAAMQALNLAYQFWLHTDV